MKIAIRFQYLAQNAKRPDAVLISDVPLEVVSGLPIPRAGEIVRHPVCPSGDLQQLVVLSVHHDVLRNRDRDSELSGWLVTVTLGDIPQDMDSRLTDIRD